MNEEWVKFGARVANVRRKLELSQREVAFSLGMQPSEYDHLERGERDPDELLSGAFSILLREKELEGVTKALKKAVREAEADRDSARKLAEEFHRDQVNLLLERKKFQEELSSVYQWIERNHADGFIDSLSYFQNLERVTDNWYDRLDRVERKLGRIERAAMAVVQRWDQPSWKDAEPTAAVINKLRNALEMEEE